MSAWELHIILTTALTATLAILPVLAVAIGIPLINRGDSRWGL